MDMTDNNPKNEVVINFFGEVDDFTTAEFQDILAQTSGEDIEILVNSPGGDVFEGITIANLLMGRQGGTTLTGVGLVASIASVILMAGDKVQMARDAMLMIHDAWGFEMGNAREMRKTAKLLDKISNQIAVVYTEQIAKNGKLIDGDMDKTREAMRTMMRAEKWLTAQEAFDLGLIDSVINSFDRDQDQQQEEERQEMAIFQANQKSDITLKAGIFNRLKTFKHTPTNILNKFQMCDCQKNKSVQNGDRLAALINSGIDDMVSDEMTRADIIAQMGEAAGIDSNTVNQILRGAINCPPLNRLEGFARVLDVSLEAMLRAGTQDGCNYTEEENKNSMNNQSFLQKLAAFFGFKAELTAIEEPKEEPKELTELEKAQALLEAAGFEINQKAEQVSEEQEPIAVVEPDLVEVADLAPQEEPIKEEAQPDPVAELTAQVESLSAKLKDLQFANASKSTAQPKESDNKKTNSMSKHKLAQFSALAELIKS
jgi:ATP-dependent protease ClpP protease subunit/transcriptional regulator with XRE-family HTH domain